MPELEPFGDRLARVFEKGVVYLLPCKLSTLAFINLIRSRSKREQEWRYASDLASQVMQSDLVECL